MLYTNQREYPVLCFAIKDSEKPSCTIIWQETERLATKYCKPSKVCDVAIYVRARNNNSRGEQTNKLIGLEPSNSYKAFRVGFHIRLREPINGMPTFWTAEVNSECKDDFSVVDLTDHSMIAIPGAELHGTGMLGQITNNDLYCGLPYIKIKMLAPCVINKSIIFYD